MSTQPTAVTGNNALTHKPCGAPVNLVSDELRGNVLVRRYRCSKCQFELEAPSLDLVWVDV